MDMRAWLDQLGFAQFAETFAENDIDLAVLPHLTEQDLKDLGLTIGQRRKLLVAIRALADDGDPAEPATGAERRQLTVMFCDLVGSTALSAKLDPEDMGEVIRAYHARCSDVVKRWDGHVAKYMGDGVLVYFGYPQAHEDDAERAVAAALEIGTAVSGLTIGDTERLAARIGIATGLVMVGELIGDGAAREQTVVGETPNLAARLQAIAAPGWAVVSASTRRLAAGMFEFEDLGTMQLKGIVDPVPAWRVIGERAAESRFEAIRIAGLTDFVGRDAEVVMLMDRWRHAKGGEGQVVLLGGEAGIGKSRITEVLRERIAVEPSVCLSFQCTPHHTNAPLYPIIKHFEHAAGFARDEADRTRLEKLEKLIDRAGSDRAAVVPLFAALLTIDVAERYLPLELTPRKQMQLTLQALADYVATIAGKQPVAMIFEDAHWIDPTSQELLALITTRIVDHRVLVVVTHRPEFQPSWSALGHLTQITLANLGRKQAAAMIANMTVGKSLPVQVLDQIVAKTDGVPLFVEELTKAVLESGLLRARDDGYALAGPLSDLAIPSTLRDSLTARLDRLAAAKTVAQIGACIGREFSYSLIAAVSPVPFDQLDDLLAQLAESGLVLQTGTPPDARYLFRHALVQDAAYESLLKSRRQSLHAEIGRAWEGDDGSAVAFDTNAIADQFAKGEIWLKAVEYYRRSAENSARAYAMREALALYDEALAAGGHLDQDGAAEILMSIHQVKAELYFTVGAFNRARTENAQMLDIARRTGDRTRESIALAGSARSAAWAEDFDAALAHAGEAIAVAEAVGCQSALGNARMTTGYVHALSGRIEPAVVELDKTLAISRSAGEVLTESQTQFMRCNIENWRGEFDKAVEIAAAGAEVARQHDLVANFLRNNYAQALALTGRGDYDAALALLNEGLALAEKVGDEAYLPRYLNGLGWLYVECENAELGLDFSHRGAELSRRRRHAAGVEMTCFAEINMGDVFLANGDLTLADESLEGVYRTVKNPATHEWMRWRYSTHLFASLGRLWLSRGDPRKAAEFAEQCLAIAVPTKSRKYIIGGWLLRGEIAFAGRDWAAAEQWFSKASDLAKAIRHPPNLWRTQAALGRVYAETGRLDLRRQANAAAGSVVQEIQRNTKDASLGDGLRGSPRLKQIRELSGED